MKISSKLISFIGKGTYGITNYEYTTFDCKKYSVCTRYFPIMAATIVRPDEILIVKTRAATEQHWQSLQQELIDRGFPEPVPVDIPDGGSREELWEIFNKLVEVVQEGDVVSFDITHSFRSLPLISFLSVAYLKYVKNVEIKALYYGAYEARDRGKNISPVFDLTEFCSLLDWIMGVNSFLNHGTAVHIGELLRQAQRTAKAKQGPAQRELNNFGGLIENISRALFTIRPFEVMELTRKLENYRVGTEQRARLERDVAEWAAPFRVLMDKLIDGFSTFAGLPDRSDPANLQRHLEMARWYVDHNYAPQALAIMRELVISKVMHQRGQYENVFDNNAREHMSTELRATIKENSLVGKLWSKLPGLRNDVLHAGWRKDVRPSQRVMEETRRCLKLMEKLFVGEEDASGRSSFQGVETAVVEEPVREVLISPLGTSPGSLYTALTHIKPELVLVVTSKQGEIFLDQITRKAGYSGEVKLILVRDPFSGYDEIPRLIDKVMSYFEELPLCHLYVNLTGGTTLLQYVVSKTAEMMNRENCRKITTVAMVDRRSVKEQQEDPYVMGEMVIVNESLFCL